MLALTPKKSIDEVLMIFRFEGYTCLPKSSKTLLGTSSVRSELNIMKCSDDTLGQFKYFGIKENLKFIIDPNFYEELKIQLLIHVDGMDVFNKSKKGFWSIMGKIFCNIHITKPFLIALFFGNSKPYSARDFLEEFVLEANTLQNEGMNKNFKIFQQI